MDGFNLLIIIGCVFLLLTILAVNQDIPLSCTEDARICPDGTAVSRDRFNNCSFLECPRQDLIKYCTNNILTVEESGNNIKTVTSLLGGGFTVYNLTNSTQCPVIAPNLISETCKNYTNLNWTSTINCTLVTNEEVYTCPTNYYEYQDYKWISCNNQEFTKYCTTDYLIWIKTNCNINIE